MPCRSPRGSSVACQAQRRKGHWVDGRGQAARMGIFGNKVFFVGGVVIALKQSTSVGTVGSCSA